MYKKPPTEAMASLLEESIDPERGASPSRAMDTEGTGESGSAPMDIDLYKVLGTSAESLGAPEHTQMPPIVPGPAQSGGEGGVALLTLVVLLSDVGAF